MGATRWTPDEGSYIQHFSCYPFSDSINSYNKLDVFGLLTLAPDRVLVFE